MTTSLAAARAAPKPGGLLLSVLGLGLAVGLRAEIASSGSLDGLWEGVLFGAVLLATTVAGGFELRLPGWRPIAAGLLGGAILIAVSLGARWPLPPLSLGHTTPLAPWVIVTVLVATAEELVLRGALWRGLVALAGPGPALVGTSLVFALIHAPVYGPSVLPLDFGVGLWLGAMRLWSGGPAAPAAAHVLADLATWWL